MERINNIPLPLRMAAVGFVVLAVMVAIYMTTMRGDGYVTVKETSVRSQAEAWSWLLERSEIKSRIEQNGSNYELRVPEAAEDKASTELGAGSKLGNEVGCTKPGTFAKGHENQAYSLCKEGDKIESLLEKQTGILGADVLVAERENDSMTGAGSKKTVTTWIYRDPSATMEMSPQQLATTIAGAAAIEPDFVTITDNLGAVLWSPSSESAGTTTSVASKTCEVAEELTVPQMEHCEEARLEQKIEADYRDLAGVKGITAHANLVLSRGVTARTAQESTPGARTKSTTSTSGGGNGNESSTTINAGSDTMTEQVVVPAGSVLRQNITVYVDAPKGTIKAIRSGLTNDYGNNSVQVLYHKMKEGSSSATATAGSADTAAPTPVVQEQPDVDTGTSSGLIGFGLFLAAVMIAVIAFLWRRSARLTAERRVFEQEFRHDMTRFQSVAQQDPDKLAREIEEFLSEQAPQARRRQ